MGAAAASEKTPLIPTATDGEQSTASFSAESQEQEGTSSMSAKFSFHFVRVTSASIEKLRSVTKIFQDDASGRVCSYETMPLGTWTTFVYHVGTVWETSEIWIVAGHLLSLSAFVAFLTFFVTVSPEALDISVFSEMSVVLKVFTAFLLGFFIKASMQRWTDTIEGFLRLFNSTRDLLMQLQVLGASPDFCDQITRYGVLSAKFLASELCDEQVDGEAQGEDALALEKGSGGTASRGFGKFHVRCLRSQHRSDTVEELLQEELLKPDEAAVLDTVVDHPTLMWVWVALILGRLAQDGQIPGMASPTYGRLMTLTQQAQEGIRTVYVSMLVQMPFVYVHMLAMLVHSNNILSAISFGLTLGQCSSRILSRFDIRVYDASRRAPPLDGSVQNDVQLIIMSMITSYFAPLLYQAALQIGLTLAQPFNAQGQSQVGAIPTDKMIETLQRDLAHARTMTDEPPGFTRPYFKK